MTFDPMSVEVTCVTLPKDHCVQVPWEYINVCGYSDQLCKLPHTYIHILCTYYVQNEWSHSLLLNSVQARWDNYWTQFRRDKNDRWWEPVVLQALFDLKPVYLLRGVLILRKACYDIRYYWHYTQCYGWSVVTVQRMISTVVKYRG